MALLATTFHADRANFLSLTGTISSSLLDFFWGQRNRDIVLSLGQRRLIYRVRLFFTRPPLARRDVPLIRARAFRFLMPLLEGVAEAALYCAHRMSTFLSCAFCEQEGHLATPSHPSSTAHCASTEYHQAPARLLLPEQGIGMNVCPPVQVDR